MKSNSPFSITCIILLLTIKTFAQIDPISAVGVGTALGKSIFGGINDKKKIKNIKNSVSEVTINGETISILRVKEDKIISPAKSYIIKIQIQLEQYYKQYNNQQHIKIPHYNNDIAFLKSQDKDWPIEYYDAEFKQYKIYEEKLEQTDQFRKDSIELNTKIRRKKTDDSLAVTKKYINDSLAYTQRVLGFHFISKEHTYLKEKPSDKSPTIGKIYKGSYIKILGSNENSQYLKISLQDIEGYVNKNDVTESLESVSATAADIETYKSRYYYKYEPNFEYTPDQTTAYSSSSLNGTSPKKNNGSSSGKKQMHLQKIAYIRGPRGGCYYINSSGTKVYVDRSNCR